MSSTRNLSTAQWVTAALTLSVVGCDVSYVVFDHLQWTTLSKDRADMSDLWGNAKLGTMLVNVLLLVALASSFWPLRNR
jgi:hypothetical protein